MINSNYTEAQLKEQGLIFFKDDLLATNVWISKYALRDKDGNYKELTPTDTIKRLTFQIYTAEIKHPNPLSYDEIYEVLKDFKYFIFGGSILYGLGNPYSVSSLGNCFFIHNGSDSYGGIFDTDQKMVQLMKRRGGVGCTIEHLRPELATVNNAARTSTGPISFMNRFSNSTREVAQDGRRGALMLSMGLAPDIDKFVISKDDTSKITGANISVKLSDMFMYAVKENADYLLTWPENLIIYGVDANLPYNKLEKYNGGYIKRIKAKELWNSIIKQAHKNAEPGILFWDTIIKESPADCYADMGFKTMGTNPCAEIPLSAQDSCRLGSLNLFSFVDNPYTKSAIFNWDKLKTISKIVQRFMDDIIDLEEEKIESILSKVENDKEDPEIKRTELLLWKEILMVLKNGRRTGIGFLGLADTMAALNIKYGTIEATEFAEKINKTISTNCYLESVNLAKERGHFPIWNKQKEDNHPFLTRILSNFTEKEFNDYTKFGRRNIANLAVAPTGSLSIVCQVSSGIEPVFKIFYRRRRKINPGEQGVKVSFVDQNGDSWEEYNVLHYPFINWYISQIDYNVSFAEAKLFLEEQDEDTLNKLILESPWKDAESHNIDYKEKVKMLGNIQKWIDHSLSCTINLPEKTTISEVNDIYFLGWETGCKGLTIYRDGSRTGVLLTKKDEKVSEFNEHDAPKRPKTLQADYYIAKADGKEFAVIIGKWLDTEKPYEIFAFENPPASKNTKGVITKIKKGQYKFINGEFEIDNIELAAERIEERSLTLTASMLLRHGAPVKHVIEVIKKIDDNVTSFSSVVRRYLSRYIPITEINGESCPECGDKLIMADGCVKCLNCGYSKC